MRWKLEFANALACLAGGISLAQGAVVNGRGEFGWTSSVADYARAGSASRHRERALDGFGIREVIKAPGEYPKHRHDKVTLSFALGGANSQEIDGFREPFLRTPGTQKLDLDRRPHRDVISKSGWHVIQLWFEPFWLERLRDFGELPDDLIQLRDPFLADLGFRLRDDAWINSKWSALTIEAVTLDALARVLRVSEHRASLPRWLSTARDAFLSNLADPPSLCEVASNVAVHPVHLSRTFRAKYGETITECIDKARLETARKLLKDVGRPLETIASELGFVDCGHFARWFRTRVASTPAAYRRIHAPLG